MYVAQICCLVISDSDLDDSTIITARSLTQHILEISCQSSAVRVMRLIVMSVIHCIESRYGFQ